MINRKKILCLAGSPRKGGNSEYCARMIFRFFKNHPNVETQFVRLVDYEIKRCRGCRTCIEKGHCIIKDDFEKVWQPFLESDIVVIGAPVFWDSPPGIMKDFIDRSHGHFTIRNLLKGKKFYLVNVAHISGFQTCEAVYQSWLDYYGAEIREMIRVYAREKNEIADKEEEKRKIQELGERIQKDISQG